MYVENKEKRKILKYPSYIKKRNISLKKIDKK